MLRVYGHEKYFNSFSAGSSFIICQNLTSTDVRFWRIKTVPALKELSLSTDVRFWRIKTVPALKGLSLCDMDLTGTMTVEASMDRWTSLLIYLASDLTVPDLLHLKENNPSSSTTLAQCRVNVCDVAPALSQRCGDVASLSGSFWSRYSDCRIRWEWKGPPPKGSPLA